MAFLQPGRGLLLSSVALLLTMHVFVPSVQAQSEISTTVKPASRPDERPQIPSALGRFGGVADVLSASQRGASSMRGGMVGQGRRHITVRRPSQPSFGDWPMSEMTDLATQELSPSFEEAGQVIDAFKAALAGNEVVALAGLLGLKTEQLLNDAATLEAYVAIRDGVEAKLEIDDRGRRQILLIGEESWPFPYPVVRDDDGKWSFDTMAGIEEVVNRRVGGNELEAISTMRTYLDAQRAYASEDRDGDGVLEFAQKLTASDDATDGLYWPASQTDGESPGGEYLTSAQERGGYYGYRFRILKGQGENIPGGSYDYIINGNMIAGFALVAWPAEYATSGLNTFLVSHHGTVYQADLGNPTNAVVKHIKLFDPDDEWETVGN